jgi:hypothetical protein
MASASALSKQLTERTNARPERQAFCKPRTSHGATSHWVRTAGLLAPLLIGEFVEDADKRWRWIRISSVATALISEAMWTHKIKQEREERSQVYQR